MALPVNGSNVLQCTLLLQQRQSMTPARHTKSFPLFPNHYFNISGLLPCCKNEKNSLSFCGAPFLWGPVRPNMLNMPKSAAAPPPHYTWFFSSHASPHSIGSSVLAQLMAVTNRHTHTQTHHATPVAIGRTFARGLIIIMTVDFFSARAHHSE